MPWNVKCPAFIAGILICAHIQLYTVAPLWGPSRCSVVICTGKHQRQLHWYATVVTTEPRGLVTMTDRLTCQPIDRSVIISAREKIDYPSSLMYYYQSTVVSPRVFITACISRERSILMTNTARAMPLSISISGPGFRIRRDPRVYFIQQVGSLYP